MSYTLFYITIRRPLDSTEKTFLDFVLNISIERNWISSKFMLRFSLSLKLRFSCTKSQTYYLLQFFLLDLRPCNPKVEKKKNRFWLKDLMFTHVSGKHKWINFKLIVKYYFLRDSKFLLMLLIFKYWTEKKSFEKYSKLMLKSSGVK